MPKKSRDTPTLSLKVAVCLKLRHMVFFFIKQIYVPLICFEAKRCDTEAKISEAKQRKKGIVSL